MQELPPLQPFKPRQSFPDAQTTSTQAEEFGVERSTQELFPEIENEAAEKTAGETIARCHESSAGETTESGPVDNLTGSTETLFSEHSRMVKKGPTSPKPSLTMNTAKLSSARLSMTVS